MQKSPLRLLLFFAALLTILQNCSQAFFAEIYEETKTAKPGKGHLALAAIERSGRLQRHYTLNVDGLAEVVGLSTWHPARNPEGTAFD